MYSIRKERYKKNFSKKFYTTSNRNKLNLITYCHVPSFLSFEVIKPLFNSQTFMCITEKRRELNCVKRNKKTLSKEIYTTTTRNKIVLPLFLSYPISSKFWQNESPTYSISSLQTSTNGHIEPYTTLINFY